jgi:hypothetical protein
MQGKCVNVRQALKGWSRRIVKEMEHWFRNGEGYFGCDDAPWGSNSGASNVETVKSRSLTLTQAKAERDMVFGYFNCKGKVIAQ